MTQVISFLQDKGGAGKTTNLLVMATAMAADGAKVVVMDTDELKASYDFCAMGKHNIKYLYVDSSDKIKPTIKKLKTLELDAIFIDTAGFESTLGTYVIANSDLVIVPCKADKLNVEKAVITYSRILSVADNFDKEIPTYLLFCDIDKGTNITQDMVELVKKASIPMLKTKVGHATGFKELVTTGVIPKSGAAKKHIESLMCELQMDRIIKYYDKSNDVSRRVKNG